MQSTTTHQIALHCEQVFFGGNWTASNLQEHLADVTWEEALTPCLLYTSPSPRDRG